ncbi:MULTISPECIES: putative quinol monooxygenase [Shewanella]|uniref:putative quinol monooxygenase n=1 Tax=Shewanella TaxID=22 RepID=UPI001EFE338B|nr:MULTISPECIES: antibiotic biosynthesis monooxygenase [Shewanella]MCG9747215.1 antibiotic biosynthesis monooxygenase [Shewanella sp. Isolate8]MCL2908765.1 antibiotic biosynthesis monooxygenase [Shewanella aquimarina]
MSTRVFVIAQFRPKAGKAAELFEVLKALEPDSLREQGCIQYILTRQIDHPSASRTDYPIVFNEIWTDGESWAAHGRRQQIQHFFETQVSAPDGLVDDAIVTAYTDEGYEYDAPVFA